MKYSAILLLTLLIAGTAAADGSVYCTGIGSVSSDVECQARLEAVERGATQPARLEAAESGASWEEPGGLQYASLGDEAEELLPVQRPANIHASTTSGTTTISWAPPIYYDSPLHCPVWCYAVEVVDIEEEDVVLEVDVIGELEVSLTTGLLAPGRQYEIRIVAVSTHADCEEDVALPGRYTYQF